MRVRLKIFPVCVPVLLFILFISMAGPASALAIEPVGPEDRAQIYGDYKISPMVLTVPLELEPMLREIPKRNPWYFPNMDIAATRAFLESVTMPESLRAGLIAKLQRDPGIDGTVLEPDEEEIFALPKKARTRLYNYLGYYIGNYEQASASRYPAATLQEWFGKANLSDSTYALLEKLNYRSGGLLCLADRSLLLSRVKNPEERFRLYRAMLRVKTYKIELIIGQESDARHLAHYLGGTRNEKQLLPIIEAHTDYGGSIDLIHLLPALPKRLLYKYPNADSTLWKIQDCHWTTLNFHRQGGGRRVLNPDKLEDAIAADYTQVKPGELRYGDLIVYLVQDGSAVRPLHSAVYICGDLAFTKNGNNLSTPWCFMRIQDMDAAYACERPVFRNYYRMNPSAMERTRNEMRGQRPDRIGNRGDSGKDIGG